MKPMHLLVRKRLVALLLPMLLPVLGLLAAAVWLGYSVAAQIAEYPGQPPHWGDVLVAALPALAMLLLLAAMAHLAARNALAPWITLAQSVQARSPKDLGQIAIAPEDPMEVRTMAEALNRLFARAHAERNAQQRFIADAAHQLRTPLAALQSQVEAWALMAHAAPEKTIHLPAQQVDQLRQASRRTTQLANQLLALSRVDSRLGQGEAAQRVDLKSLCETLLESFLDSALEKGLDLGLEAESAHVSGHEWLLRELISNLLDNAIKYTPPGGQVTLRCGKHVGDERQVRAYVEVEDDGPGVPVGEYTRLTQRFYRVPGAQAEGTGLGLAIAEEIAQEHGAALYFGKGANEAGMKVQLLFGE